MQLTPPWDVISKIAQPTGLFIRGRTCSCATELTENISDWERKARSLMVAPKPSPVAHTIQNNNNKELSSAPLHDPSEHAPSL